MSFTTLRDDLLAEFRAEQVMIAEQIVILDPLPTSLRRPAAQRLAGSTLLICAELACYLLAAAGAAYLFVMHQHYLYKALGDMMAMPGYRAQAGMADATWLVLAIYGITGLCALLLFAIGRMARVIRLKNAILNLAGRDIKTIVGQHLERKAILDTLEQRHMLGQPGIVIPAAKAKATVNDVINPGYGEE